MSKTEWTKWTKEMIDKNQVTRCTLRNYDKSSKLFPLDTKGYRVIGRHDSSEWYTEEAFDRYFEVIDPPA